MKSITLLLVSSFTALALQPPCQTCDPNNNKCTITTSCISFLNTGVDYCACRAGYRASGLAPTDPLQFRLDFPGQEYRVFVAQGVECDQLCTNPFPGPDSCQEVPVQQSCQDNGPDSADATPLQGETSRGTPSPPSPLNSREPEDDNTIPGPSIPTGTPRGPINPSSP